MRMAEQGTISILFFAFPLLARYSHHTRAAKVVEIGRAHV